MDSDILLYAGIGAAVVAAIVVIFIVIGSRAPPQVPPAMPVYTYPADSSYISVGDSTADGTPVVTATVIQPVSTPVSAPVVSTPVSAPAEVGTPVVSTPVVSTPVVGTPVVSTPVVSTPVVDPVVCDMQKDAIISYYSSKNPEYTPSIVGVNKLSDSVCEAGLLLSQNGSVVLSDVRKFTFGLTGILSSDPVQTPTVQMPVVLGPVSAVSAPQFPALADIGRYFTAYIGSIWEGAKMLNVGIGSLQTCQRACYDDPICTGVVYDPALPDNCIHVSERGFPVLTPSSSNFYRRLPTTITPNVQPTADLSKYKMVKDVQFRYDSDQYNNPYTTGSLNQCALDCQGSAGCTGFHWTDIGGCALVNGTKGQFSAKPGLTYYYLPPVFPSLTPGDNTDYLQYYNETTGKIILDEAQPYNATTTMECAAMCKRDPNCSGFNRLDVSGLCQNVSAHSTKPSQSLLGASFYALKPPATTTTVVRTPTPVYTTPTTYVPTTYTAPAPTVGGVSTNERCGPNWGGTKCPTGLCCSGSDWCGPAVGTTTAWCSAGGRGRDGGIYDGV